jgi:GNAT superfamily N-acetyltransferase
MSDSIDQAPKLHALLSPPGYTIRLAGAGDGGAVRRIERAAAARFASVGMLEIAGGSGMTPELVNMFLRRGAIFLLLHGARPVGFVAACTLDGAGHVAELDVVPKHAGKRLGSNLIDVAADWARTRGCRRLTLTTYRDVPWNAPYYARLGFREVALDALGAEHRNVWEGQREMGLSMERRLVMAKEL